MWCAVALPVLDSIRQSYIYKTGSVNATLTCSGLGDPLPEISWFRLPHVTVLIPTENLTNYVSVDFTMSFAIACVSLQHLFVSLQHMCMSLQHMCMSIQHMCVSLQHMCNVHISSINVHVYVSSTHVHIS